RNRNPAIGKVWQRRANQGGIGAWTNLSVVMRASKLCRLSPSPKLTASRPQPGKFHDVIFGPRATLSAAGILPFNVWLPLADRESKFIREGYPPMWNHRSDLKVRLTLRVAAVSALCFAAISAYFLIEADRSVRARINAIAEVAARTLELQQNKLQWVN